jgi:hypothetical protein
MLKALGVKRLDRETIQRLQDAALYRGLVIIDLDDVFPCVDAEIFRKYRQPSSHVVARFFPEQEPSQDEEWYDTYDDFVIVGRTRADQVDHRERRWLVVVEDGSHATLGRDAEPSVVEVARAGSQLDRMGLAGWLAVSEGGYRGQHAVALLMIRQITVKHGDWTAAEARWQELRNEA